MKLMTPVVGRITSGFGPRNLKIRVASKNHRGVDIAPPKRGQRGVHIHSPADGTVVSVGDEGARGLIVRIKHPGGWQSWHQHLAEALVAPGQKVTIGEDIGVMGNTPKKLALGVHLHLEIHPKGDTVAVDPVLWFKSKGVQLAKDAPPVELDVETTLADDAPRRFVVDAKKVGSKNLIGRTAPKISPKTVRFRRPAGFKITIVATQKANGRLWGVTRHGTFYAMEFLKPVA